MNIGGLDLTQRAALIGDAIQRSGLTGDQILNVLGDDKKSENFAKIISSAIVETKTPNVVERFTPHIPKTAKQVAVAGAVGIGATAGAEAAFGGRPKGWGISVTQITELSAGTALAAAAGIALWRKHYVDVSYSGGVNSAASIAAKNVMVVSGSAALGIWGATTGAEIMRKDGDAPFASQTASTSAPASTSK